tara:strand:- start:2924 stop:3889 length:966 start_codon:yes stop_codon:yes gene_type:complete
MMLSKTFMAWKWIVLVPFVLLSGCKDDTANVALGVLAKERVSLSATASEIVTDLPISEGSPVKVGDILVRLDDTLQQANVALAEAQLAQAQADLDKLIRGARAEEVAIAQANVEAAEAAFAEADTALARETQLLERNTITQARFDQVLARQNETRAQLTSTQQRLHELTSGAREEDVLISQAQVSAANARLAAEQGRLSNLVIRSSRDGVLDNLPWNLGERVSQGSPVAIILAGEVPFARVYVPEPARVRISEGDVISIQIDGLDASIEGHVRWISNEPSFTPYYALNQTERSRLMYLAEIDLPVSAANLSVGVPVQAILP